jgi:signal transduction histidine kinase
VTRRLVLSYVLLAAFVLLVVELPLGLTYAARAQERLLADVERDARVLAGLVEERVESGDDAAVAMIAEQYSAQSDGRVVVTDPDGISVVDTDRPDGGPRDFSTRPEIEVARSGRQATGIRRSDTLDEELAYVAVPISSDGVLNGVVRVSFPTDEVREQVRENWVRLAMLSVLVLAGAASLGWLVARWATGPVEQLEAGAARLASGDLTGRADVDRGPPELQHLAATFNDMAARLEVLVHSQRAFVADASHQLRTPLTALRLRIESLEDGLDDGRADPEVARADLEAIDAELQRLGELVEGLLALARSESGTAPTEALDATKVADDAVARWRPLADEHGVGLRLDTPDTAMARAVPGSLDQILDNLLDNALGVAPHGSTIDVSVLEHDREVELSVRDHGPGLSPRDRARATDRFWRAPDAAPGGTGLGLAIVDQLARVSGGSVRLDEPAEGTGLVVTVRVPRERAGLV